ncbi:MAG: hypothetical protein QOD42_2354 [Sphingomonadales bacterium]|jgi:hypothetical protein|nr:hypothetical protein [Sphingomonadales bacterium]
MSTPSSVSAESLAAVSALADQLPPDQTVGLDPANATHRAAIEAGLAAAGRTGDRYPALFAALDGSAGAGADDLRFIDKGADRSGLATATTWHASPEGTLLSGGTLFALDADGGALLALGDNSSVRQGFLTVSTDTASAKSAGSALKLLSVNHSLSSTGEAQFTATASSATLGTDLAMDDGVATVTVPTSTPIHTNPTYVKIGVNRPNNPPPTDCDYYYSDNAVDNPYLIVPFTGSASLPYEITGTPGQPIPGAVYLTQIYYQGGGQPIAMNTTYTQTFTAKVTMDGTDPTKLNWGYTYVAGQSYTNTSSLVYNPGPVNDPQYSYFFYSFEIPVSNAPTPTFSFNVCSVDTPGGKTAQCTEIPNLMFTWHCLAAGTKIALADGGGAAIEDVTSAHRVLTGEGDAHLAVEATTRGAHSAKAGAAPHQAVYRLTTDGGHELTASGRHPIQTPNGLVPLYDLAPGDELVTDGGTACVAECVAIDHEGMLFNLQLGDDGDRASGLADGAVCTFVANGIVVGDAMAQVNEHRRLSRDLDHMKSILPGHLFDDYASAVADIRY